MTTIAYRDGWLVGEGRETAGKRIDTDRLIKIHRLPDGSLFGAAGPSHTIMGLLTEVRKISTQKKRTLNPFPAKNVQALLLCSSGYKYYFEGNTWNEMDEEYFAIGSGSDYALAAMDAGATAEEAVKIACKRDPFSGGKIRKQKV